MTRNGKLIFAGAAAMAVGLATAGAVAYGDWGPGRGMRHHGGAMGMTGFGFGGPMTRFCRGDSSEIADHILVRIEHKAKPTDAQKSAFEDLKTATRAAAEKAAAACPKKPWEEAKDGKSPMLTPIDRLDRAEARLQSSLDAIKTIRPAAEKFYAALSDDQKAKFTERHGRWHRGDRGGRRPEGAEGAPDAAPDADTPPSKE